LRIACSVSVSAGVKTRGLRFLGNAMPRLKQKRPFQSSYLENRDLVPNGNLFDVRDQQASGRIDTRPRYERPLRPLSVR
jgi:hypothetical protein